jgi:predicted transcriptional regulator
MSGETDRLIAKLNQFGLEVDDARIYLTLLEKGESSALQISRTLGIARTRVYRILDKLIDKRLVILKQASSGFRFVVGDPGRIEDLVIQKEVEVQELKNGVVELIEDMKGMVGRAKSNSKILYYQGQRGLSQVNWNLLKTDGEVLSYEVATADAYIPQLEAEKLRKQMVDNKITVRTITNKIRIEPFTEVVGLTDLWGIRSVDPKVLDIKEDVFIYNNVYTWCQYLETGDVFCVEIYNEKMANMQRQLFENMWNVARKMKVVSAQGEAVLA